LSPYVPKEIEEENEGDSGIKPDFKEIKELPRTPDKDNPRHSEAVIEPVSIKK